jgi:predicted amino acid racemase
MLRLTVDIDKITENYLSVKKTCDEHRLSLVVVAKLCLTNLDMMKPLIDAGAQIVAESNLVNLASLPYHVERMLLRASLDDIRMGLDHCDYVFLSEYAFFEALAESRLEGGRSEGRRAEGRRAEARPGEDWRARSRGGERIGAFIAVEGGDLREGATWEELPELADRAAALRGGPRVAGFAANYGCLRGFVPDRGDILRFRELCTRSAARAGLRDYHVSLGGTTVFDMLADGSLDGLADQIRIGEAIYFGYNMCLGKRISGLHDDALILTGEVIEAKEKLVTEGEPRGRNAFGHLAYPTRPGTRRRAILNFGELAAPTRSLEPLLKGAFFDGATHDYTVLDITDCEDPPRPGDPVSFRTNYNSAAQAMLSPYVEKVMVAGASREERG